MADIYTAIRSRSLPVSLRIAELAARQHGVAALWQLLRVGVSRSAVQRRIENGLLFPLQAGVYAVGHREVGDLGRLAAARLAIGPGSAITGLASAAAWRFHAFPLVAPIEVIAPRGQGKRRRGIKLVHTRSLPARDLALVEGIWTTSVPRTLIEITASAPSWRTRRLYEEADRIHLIEAEAMGEALERCRNRRGTGILRELAGTYRAPTPRTESHAEYRFFRLWEVSARPLPEVNVGVCGHMVDFLWRDLRLIVELDGSSYHDRKGQGERDRQRDVELSLAGYRVQRFGTDRVYKKPQTLLDEIAALIELRRRELG